MEVRTTRIPFNELRGSGPRTRTQEVIFGGPVSQAAAMLRGFDVAFSNQNGRDRVR